MIDKVSSNFSLLVKWVGAVVMVYFGYLAVKSLSGKETLANIVFDWAADLKMNQWLAWAIAVVLGGALLRERQFRQRKVESLTDQKRALEQIIDAKVESSRLLRSGNTRPEDEV